MAGHARRTDRHVALSRVLKNHHVCARVDRRNKPAPANRRGPAAAQAHEPRLERRCRVRHVARGCAPPAGLVEGRPKVAQSRARFAAVRARLRSTATSGGGSDSSSGDAPADGTMGADTHDVRVFAALGRSAEPRHPSRSRTTRRRGRSFRRQGATRARLARHRSRRVQRGYPCDPRSDRCRVR